MSDAGAANGTERTEWGDGGSRLTKKEGKQKATEHVDEGSEEGDSEAEVELLAQVQREDEQQQIKKGQGVAPLKRRRQAPTQPQASTSTVPVAMAGTTSQASSPAPHDIVQQPIGVVTSVQDPSSDDKHKVMGTVMNAHSNAQLQIDVTQRKILAVQEHLANELHLCPRSLAFNVALTSLATMAFTALQQAHPGRENLFEVVQAHARGMFPEHDIHIRSPPHIQPELEPGVTHSGKQNNSI
ncbi:hypothetical protein HWV62_11471 [Athelia sp. TMB]|nr:hypothetical protein HWV62_11471 [Athelia sp. TMB]